MGTICLVKVAEMEVKKVAEREQVCTAFQEDFRFSMRVG